MIDSALGVIDRLSRLAAWLGAAFLTLIAILMLSEIVWRAGLGRSLGVTWELATYCMAAVMFLGAADTLRTGGHVRVGVLLETLPASAARMIDAVATAIALAVAGFVLFAVCDFVLDSYLRGTRSFEPSRVLLWIPQSVMVVGIVLLVLQIAARLARVLTGRPAEETAPAAAADVPAAGGDGR